MKNIITIAILFLNTTIVFSQTRQIKYGVEADIIPFHEDDLKESTLFSLSGFVGGFVEFGITNNFKLNGIAGINNIYAQEYYLDGSNEYPSQVDGFNKRSIYRATFEVKVEPRYYLFGESKSWGNIYGAIPISYETPHFQKTVRKAHKLKVIPSIGYQFNLSKHLSTDIYGGIGWTYMRYKYVRYNWESTNCGDYLLGVRLRYSFRL